MVERRALPLFDWDERRRAARRRRRLALGQGALIALGCACVAATIAAPPLPRLVWNASASAPIGLYRVEPVALVARGDMVLARTPLSVRALAAWRHYVPANVPLVKRIAGVAGDRVCAAGTRVTLNGRPIAARRARDRLGRALPWWKGCRTLGAGTVFLLMAGVPDSFDGRYFGPTPASDALGKATPLWVEPSKDPNND